MTIPFQNFEREYNEIKDEVLTSCDSFFKKGIYILGPFLESFEHDFAKQFGYKHAVGVANGTDAITFALRGLELPVGSEVIMNPLTAYATVIGIMNAGLIPRFCDIDASTGLIDPISLEKQITSKTKVILPVHLYGQMSPMKKVKDIAAHYNLQIVEDCAQSLGAAQRGRRVGSYSQLAAFSFYPTKNLGAYGDGGAVICKSKRCKDKISSMRNYGQKTRYKHSIWGINSRLDPLQAALLQIKMKKVDSWIKQKQSIASYYLKNLKTVQPLHVSEHNYHTYHLFVVKTPKRKQFMKYLSEKGIATVIHYPIPVYKQKVFTLGNYHFPKVEQFVKNIVSIPLYPHLTDNEVDYIVQTINKY